jgi:diphosphomevalonate decarboxylase
VNPVDIVQLILQNKSLEPQKKMGEGRASTNIALIKYWGKKDERLRIPTNSSLSVALPDKSTLTKITLSDKNHNEVILNGKALDVASPFANRLSIYLDYFRSTSTMYFKINTEVNFPVAAGLASSASGFAALVLALNDFFAWQLTKKELSILARLGSGSACRSLWSGFVEWHAGSKDDGMDSYAEQLDITWPELCAGVIVCEAKAKKINSTIAMQHTMSTSPFFNDWVSQSNKDLMQIKEAIQAKDFVLMGEIAEANAMMMHASCIAARPAILYWQPETLAIIHKIQALRQQGVPVYLTIDAGANLVLFFIQDEKQAIIKALPKAEILQLQI